MTNEQCMRNIRNNLLLEYGKSNKRNLSGFACLCEISEGELGKILYSKKNIYLRLSTVLTISNALGKPVSWLIGEPAEHMIAVNNAIEEIRNMVEATEKLHIAMEQLKKN